MKKLKIYYWIFTGLLVPALGISSVMALLGDPQSAAVITALGYPAYLSPFMGAARILALIAIISSYSPRLKEWAYAGLVFDIVGAVYSIIAAGNPIINTVFPLLALGIVFSSYFLYHKRRKLTPADTVLNGTSGGN